MDSSAARCRVSLDQSGVVQRDAEAGGERGEHAHVRVGECALTIEALDQHDPGHLAGDHHRHEHDRFRELTGDRWRLAEFGRPSLEVAIDEQRLAVLDDPFPEAE